MESADHRHDEPSPGEFLFAYGTLQSDHAPDEIADVVRGFVEAGKGFVQGTLYDLGSYPGAVLEKCSSRRIWGTVFRLPEAGIVLQRLDAYEECDPKSPRTSLFIRRRCTVQLTGGPELSCWIYEYNGSRERASIVESGTYAG